MHYINHDLNHCLPGLAGLLLPDSLHHEAAAFGSAALLQGQLELHLGFFVCDSLGDWEGRRQDEEIHTVVS